MSEQPPTDFHSPSKCSGIIREDERVARPARCCPQGPSKTNETSAHSNAAIAIVGMAFRMPGASDVESLWNILESGASTLSEIPPSRFEFRDYVAKKVPGRAMEVTTGNFLHDVASFDNEMFRISPREAKSMDPQQRVLLHVASEALQDAGYVPNATSTFDPETFGVFIGVATNDYVHNLRDDIDVHYTSGTLPAFLSGRISFAMGFSGPSMGIDTACSSSGVALHQAVRSLQNKDCNAAIAGGVNVISSPDLFIGLDSGHFLSPTGQSCPFDADADGYSRAEGCVLFVLKRLSEALLENDQILGIIRGAEVNHSGEATSITRTHAPTQAKLLKRLLQKAQVHPCDIDVVEAHAAGTKVGDTTEIQALKDVFGEDHSARPLYLTSIKANFGHSEAASGAASLLKVLLMLKHRRIPGQIGVTTLNPVLAQSQTGRPLVVPDNALDWESPSAHTPRFAIVDNYGASGSNSTVLVQEYNSNVPRRERAPGANVPFALSAPRLDTLLHWRDHILEWMRRPSTANIPVLDIAYTLTARRQPSAYRLAFSFDATVGDSLSKELQNCTAHKVDRKELAVVFVFAGQSSQYRGMGASLYRDVPSFRADVDECSTLALAQGWTSPFLPYLLEEAEAPTDAVCGEALALFAFEYALARLWISWGVKPHALLGHSFGEYVALVVAGVLLLKDAIAVVIMRAKLIRQHCTTGTTGMLSVPMAIDDLRLILAMSRFRSLTIACFNSCHHSTLAGSLDTLRCLQAYVAEKHDVHDTRLLPMPLAYHSPALEPIRCSFKSFLDTVSYGAPSIPIASTVTGRLILPGDCATINSSYLISHSIDPVQFHQATISLLNYSDFSNARPAWVEIGPQQGHLTLLRGEPSMPLDAVYLGSAKRKETPHASLSQSIARASLTNLNINWRRVFEMYGSPRCISVPFLPFKGSQFWVQYKDPSLSCARDVQRTASLAQYLVQRPTDEGCVSARFEIPVERFGHQIRGHEVRSLALCPTSVYADVVLQGANTISRHPAYSPVLLEDVEFVRPLVADQFTSDVLVLTTSTRDDSEAFDFTIASGSCHSSSDHDLVLLSTGHFKRLSRSNLVSEYSSLLPSIKCRIDALKDPSDETVEIMHTSTVYDIIFPRVVRYSSEYHAVRRILVSRSRLEAFGTLRLPEKTFDGQFVIHPVFLDALCHIAGFLVNLRARDDSAYLCVGFESLTGLPEAFDGLSTYDFFCAVEEIPGGNVCVAETTILDHGRHRRIFARVKGLRFQKLSLTAFVRSLDRPSLSRSTQDLAGTSPISLSSTLNSCDDAPDLRQILSSTLYIPVNDIDESTPLESLGLDSFTSMEILHRIKSRHHIDFPSTFFQQWTTVGEAQTFLNISGSALVPAAQNQNPTPVENYSSPFVVPKPISTAEPRGLHLLKSSQSGRVPLCLIHDGSGMIESYRALCDIGRSVWGIEAVVSDKCDDDDDSDRKSQSLAEMVEWYADLVLAQFNGPVILGGWSFGGVVAFEVAKVMESRRPGVLKGVVLIDSPCPSDHVYLCKALVAHIFLELDSGETKLVCAAPAMRSRRQLEDRFLHHSALLRAHYAATAAQAQGLSSLSPRAPQLRLRALRTTPILIQLLLCEEGTRLPQPSSAHPWFTDRSDLRELARPWKEWERSFGTVEVTPVQGDHFSLFKPQHIRSTSVAIKAACERID